MHVMAVNCGKYRSRSVGSVSNLNFNATAFQESLTAAVKSTSGMSLEDANPPLGRTISDTMKEEAELRRSGSGGAGGSDGWENMSADNQAMDIGTPTTSGTPAPTSLALALTLGNTPSKAELEKVDDFIRKQSQRTTTESLPHLAISNSSRTALYLLSPYCTGSINNCVDCDLVIGPVAGTLILSDCERVRLSVMTRKIILRNCLDCVVSCSTLSPVIIAGDSRGLMIGKHTTILLLY